MIKRLDGIWPLKRLKGGQVAGGQIIVAQNTGVTPEGELRPMRPAEPTKYLVRS